jgi:hypothetical protein
MPYKGNEIMKKFNDFIFTRAAVLLAIIAVFGFAGGCEQITESLVIAEKNLPEVRNKQALYDAFTGDVKEFTIPVSLNTTHEITVKSDKVITIPAGVVVTLNKLTAEADITIIGPGTVISAKSAAIAKSEGGEDDNDAGVVLIKKSFDVHKETSFNLKGSVKLGFYPAVTAESAIVDGFLAAENEDSIFWIAGTGGGGGAGYTFGGAGSVKTSVAAGPSAAAEASISGKQAESLPFEVPAAYGGDDEGDGTYLFDPEDDTPYTETKATSVTLNNESLTLELGKTGTAQLTATVLPAEAVVAGVMWASSKPGVAAVDAYGLVTAHNRGTAVIYAKAKAGGAPPASCIVTVKGGLKAGLYQNVGNDLDMVELTDSSDNMLVRSFAWIKANSGDGDNKYTIVLDSDITVSAGWTIGSEPTSSSTGNDAKNKNLKITLQGLDKEITIKLAGANTGALFTVYGSAADGGDLPELILDENITLSGDGNNTSGDNKVNNSALVVIGDNGGTKIGKLTMNAGRITGNNNNNTVNKAGGVMVFKGSTFVMNGGTIDYNKSSTAAGTGGGVTVAGTFEMKGGSIENNSVGNSTSANAWGAGVYVAGTFDMSNGTIQNNTNTSIKAAGSYGGGVCTNGTFIMSGGNILNNTAQGGGGVAISSDKTFTMSGGIIGGNTAAVKGAAVFRYGNGTFEKTGNSIIYGNAPNIGTNANKGTQSDTVHSIEMGNSLVAYYDETAGVDVVLKHSNASGYQNVGSWSK